MGASSFAAAVAFLAVAVVTEGKTNEIGGVVVILAIVLLTVTFLLLVIGDDVVNVGIVSCFF